MSQKKKEVEIRVLKLEHRLSQDLREDGQDLGDLVVRLLVMQSTKMQVAPLCRT